MCGVATGVWHHASARVFWGIFAPDLSAVYARWRSVSNQTEIFSCAISKQALYFLTCFLYNRITEGILPMILGGY